MKKKIILLTSLLVIVILLLNIAFIFVPQKYKKFDLTVNRSFSLSKETIDYISSLDESVTIYVINGNGGNLQYEHLLQMFDDNSEKIEVLHRMDYELADKLTPLGWDGSTLSAYTLLLVSDKRTNIIGLENMYYYVANGEKMSYTMYEYYYRLYSQNAALDERSAESFYEFLTSTQLYFCAENMICGSIEYILLDLVPHAYYLNGHGEESIDDSLLGKGFYSYALDYELLDLSQNPEIPPDANCLIINAPTSDYTASETQIIKDYLKAGGALTLMTNEKNLEMPNLMSIVETYGVSASKGLVAIDKEDLPEDTAVSSDYNKNIISPVINPDHDSLYALSTYNFSIRNANEIIVPESTPGAIIISKMLTTSDKAYVGDDNGSKASRTIAVAIEDGETEIMWYTGADTFSKDHIGTDTMLLPIYSTMWCGEDYISKLADVDDKQQVSNELLASQFIVIILGVILCVAIPAGVMSVGIVMYRKRQKS